VLTLTSGEGDVTHGGRQWLTPFQPCPTVTARSTAPTDVRPSHRSCLALRRWHPLLCLKRVCPR
jgi:hypothetical protein